MSNGVFSGIIWGALVAGVGAGGLSLAYPDFKPQSPGQIAQDGQNAEAAAVSLEAEVPETVEQAVGEAEAPEQETAAQEESPSAEQGDVAEDALLAAEPQPDLMPALAAEALEGTGAAEEAPLQSDVQEGEDPGEPQPEPIQEAEQSADAEVDPAPETEQTEIASTDEKAEAPSVTEEIIAALPKPAGTIGDRAPEVTTDRLPSLAQDEEAGSPEASEAQKAPFELFAADYNPESDKPLMAIVLIDEGDSALGVEALEAFPYPLTFAVDAGAPDAAERMQVYRDKGFEVLALVDLPRGASASDVEVAMSANFAAIPEAVGILEGVETGVQSSREMADQLTQIVLESGHGMLLQASGLNTARKLAERDGVPAGTVFRDFDGNGQSASVMRRFLDQAAFRAGQEGGVVMMGRLQAETISALLIWGLADRANRVALVPVSAVLKSGEAEQ